MTCMKIMHEASSINPATQASEFRFFLPLVIRISTRIEGFLSEFSLKCFQWVCEEVKLKRERVARCTSWLLLLVHVAANLMGWVAGRERKRSDQISGFRPDAPRPRPDEDHVVRTPFKRRPDEPRREIGKIFNFESTLRGSPYTFSKHQNRFSLTHITLTLIHRASTLHADECTSSTR